MFKEEVLFGSFITQRFKRMVSGCMYRRQIFKPVPSYAIYRVWALYNIFSLNLFTFEILYSIVSFLATAQQISFFTFSYFLDKKNLHDSLREGL